MFFGTSNQIIGENPCLQTEANFQQKFPAFNTILTSANIQNIIQFNVLNAYWYTLASKHSSSLSAARPGKNQKVFWYTFPFLFSLFFQVLRILTPLVTSSPEVSARGAVIDEPAKLAVAAVVLVIAALPETAMFSAVAPVAVNITTVVALVTENPVVIAPENAAATATVAAESIVTVTVVSAAIVSGVPHLHIRQRNPIA